MNAVAPFIGNVQLSNIMLRNQQVCLYKNVILYKVAYQQQQQQFYSQTRSSVPVANKLMNSLMGK